VPTVVPYSRFLEVRDRRTRITAELAPPSAKALVSDTAGPEVPDPLEVKAIPPSTAPSSVAVRSILPFDI
jgi:hypothetical protein